MLIPQQKLATPSLSEIVNSAKLNNLDTEKYFPNGYWTPSARAAIKLLLDQLKVQEVLLPAFTCKVVLNAIKLASTKPVLFDSGMLTDYKELKDKIKG